MFVAGIDAHATYSVTCVVSKEGQLVSGPTRSGTRMQINSVNYSSRIEALLHGSEVRTDPLLP